ncbi:MAG: NADH-quinone oxidoreductase subunit A [Anaerolineales bacterium]|nr:NADH-quinone oxidoreductase subunit A [Anaerolineales bacterium]
MAAPEHLPFIIYLVLVIIIASGAIGISYVLGERHSDRKKGEPYESGIQVTGMAWSRLSANFYMIAILFVIFDLETIFIIAWALGVIELGWPGFIGALVFILVLVVALIYEWRMGTLDWGPKTMLEYRRRMKELAQGGASGEMVAEQTQR